MPFGQAVGALDAEAHEPRRCGGQRKGEGPREGFLLLIAMLGVVVLSKRLETRGAAK